MSSDTGGLDPDKAAPLEPNDLRFTRNELNAIHQLVAASAGLSDGARTWGEVAADYYLGERTRISYQTLIESPAGTWWTHQGRFYVLVPTEEGGTTLLALTPPGLMAELDERAGAAEATERDKNPDASQPRPRPNPNHPNPQGDA